ncbi:MAG TPA: hypothetical protein VNO26_01620 [Candidatus Limnocylindria bacterium]|nr:hypothetical protein [Candidatus Limnocylindria bacterium]
MARDRAMLERAVDERRPWLRLHAWPGDVLLLGRHHPSLGAQGAVRRRSGGRAMPAGAGFVQLTLALPHRSALESDEPYALRPEQVLNRAVRGIMGGLETLGLEPYYPGRDLVTVGSKPIGWISLAVEAGGGTLVEAGIAVGRGFDVLPGLADRLDPGGAVPVTLWHADDVTTVAASRPGSAPTAGEVALAIVEGYRRRLGFELAAAQLDERAGESCVDDLRETPGRPRGRRASQLGAVLASARIEARGLLADVWLGGDVIAPAATMEALARAFEGQPASAPALRVAAEPVLAQPDAFLLGATVDDLVAAVLAAVAP